MKIVNAGYKYTHESDFVINRPIGSGDYVFLVLRTNAFFVLNGERIIAAKGSVIIYKKGTPQLYGACESSFTNDWIHFELNESEYEWTKSIGILFDKILPINNYTVFSSLIKSIFSEQYSKSAHSEESTSLYLRLIFLKLSEALHTPTPDFEGAYYKAFADLRGEIYSSPASDFAIDTLCRRLNLSRSYLQHLYKAIFGTTVSADVTASRIEHAKYLLYSTDDTVASISVQCGYKNDVHFMRLFKSATGMTPSAYRKEKRISKKEVLNSQSKPPFKV